MVAGPTETSAMMDLRKLSAMDIAVATAGLLGTALLFYIDSVSPRGVLDGIGYPVVVIVAARFGRIPLYAWTGLCTALIVIAQFLVPNEGISVEGEIANRVFGVASIWIIAWLMGRRLSDERTKAFRER